MSGMKTGKVPVNVLKRWVLGQIGTKDGGLFRGAGLGSDCAVFPYDGEGPLVSCIQEAVVRLEGADCREAFMTMPELIQKCANNLAAAAATPLAAMIALLLPENTEESVLKTLMRDAQTKCGHLSMEIIGGQSRVTAAVAAPVAVVTAYGKTITREWQDRKAKPGQDVVLSKWIGLQGTAVLARENRQRLCGRYPAYLVEEAEKFGRYLSVLPEAGIAVQKGVRAMHDASEGGIFGALWEMAEGAGVGLQIDMKKLPLRQETVEVCEYCNVNPYELLSGGCLIMTTEDGFGLAAALEAEHIPAVVVGKVTSGKERVLIGGEEIRYMNRPERDGIYSECAAILAGRSVYEGAADGTDVERQLAGDRGYGNRVGGSQYRRCGIAGHCQEDSGTGGAGRASCTGVFHSEKM